MELLIIILAIAFIGFFLSMAFNKLSSKPKVNSTLTRSSSLSQASSNTVTLKTLDGGNLIFSDEGVTYISNDKQVFIRKSDIVSFNYEKLSDDVYRVKIASNFEVIDTTINKEELKKLFMPISGSTSFSSTGSIAGSQIRNISGLGAPAVTPTFSWLGPLLGFGAGMVAGSLLDDLFSSSHAAPSIEESIPTHNVENDDNINFVEDNEATQDLDVDAGGFGIDTQDSSYDEFSQDLDEPSFDSDDDLSFPDDDGLV